MFKWLSHRKESSPPEIEVRNQIREMFENLETSSYRGEVKDDET